MSYSSGSQGILSSSASLLDGDVFMLSTLGRGAADDTGGAVVRSLALNPTAASPLIVLVKETRVELHEFQGGSHPMHLRNVKNAWGVIVDAQLVQCPETNALSSSATSFPLLALLGTDDRVSLVQIAAQLDDSLYSSSLIYSFSIVNTIALPHRMLPDTPVDAFKYLTVNSYGDALAAVSLGGRIEICTITHDPVELSIPFSEELSCWIWAATFTFAERGQPLKLLIGARTLGKNSHFNSIFVITIDLSARRVTVQDAIYSFGRDVHVGMGLIPIPPKTHVILIEEERLALLDMSLSKSQLIASRRFPSWTESHGAEHRQFGASPLCSGFVWSADRLLLVFESGDLYWLQLFEDRQLNLVHIGLINPSRSIASIQLPPGRLADCIITNPSDCSIIIAPGDLCDGSIAAIDWGNVQSTDGCLLFKLQTLVSNAPILDIAIARPGELNMDTIAFLACGLGKHGAIRSVSFGVHAQIQVASAPEFRGVQSVFTLSASHSDPHKLIVFSFVASTRVLAIDVNDQMDDVSVESGIVLDEETLYAGMFLNGERLVQVCNKVLRSVSVPKSNRLHAFEWTPRHGDYILNCAGSQSSNVLVLSVGPHPRLIAITILSDCFNEFHDVIDLPSEASCINIVHSIRGVESNEDVIAVGLHCGALLWYKFMQRGWIPLFNVNLTTLHHSLELNGIKGIPIVHSIVVMEGSTSIALIGLRDGSLLQVNMASPLSMDTQRGSHIRQLGLTAVQLCGLDVNSHGIITTVLALCDRSWLIRRMGESISVVPLLCGHAQMNRAAAFRGKFIEKTGIIAALASSICILSIPSNQGMFCTLTFALRKTPRRVYYHRASQTLATICVDITSTGQNCRLYIICPRTGRILDSFRFKGETALALEEWNAVDGHSYLVVGTVIGEDVRTCGKGRILLFRVERNHSIEQPDDGTSILFSQSNVEPKSSPGESGKLKLLSQCTVPGAAYALCKFREHYMIASAGNRVFILHLDGIRMKSLCQTASRYFVIAAAVNGDSIAIGDERDGIMRVQYNQSNHDLSIIETDPFPRLISRALMIGSRNGSPIIAGDKHGGLFILNSSLQSSKRDQLNSVLGKTFASSGFFNVHETVTQLKFGRLGQYISQNNGPGEDALESSNDTCFILSTLLGTLYGGYAVDVSNAKSLFGFQHALNQLNEFKPLLGNEYGAFRSCIESPRGWIDGDMLLTFASQPRAYQERVLNSLPSNVDVAIVQHEIAQLTKFIFG